jgi:hypothetical protein
MTLEMIKQATAAGCLIDGLQEIAYMEIIEPYAYGLKSNINAMCFVFQVKNIFGMASERCR